KVPLFMYGVMKKVWKKMCMKLYYKTFRKKESKAQKMHNNTWQLCNKIRVINEMCIKSGEETIRLRRKNKKALETMTDKYSDVEDIKIQSNYLRGTLVETFADTLSGGIPDEDNRLMKFHGSYMQDDRDVRLERQRQKLEPAYQFMIR